MNTTKRTTAATWVLIFLVVSNTAIAISTDTPDFATCNTNTTCPIGEYCLDGFCEMCVPCEIRGRKSPPQIDGIVCAKEEAECGDCLPGFKEQSLTDASSRKEKCYPMDSISYKAIALVLGVIAFFALGIWLLRKQLKKLNFSCRKPKSQNSDSNQLNLDAGNLSNGHVKSKTNGIELHSYKTTVV